MSPKEIDKKTIDFNIKNTFKIPFNGSKSNIAIFPSRKLLKEAYNWADVIHVHEPHIPYLFWNLPKDKKLIFTFHASFSKFVILLLKFLYFFYLLISKLTYSFVTKWCSATRDLSSILGIHECGYEVFGSG